MPDLSSWQSLYQGGLGTRLTCSTSTTNSAVPGSGVVSQMLLTNMGNVTIFVKVGGDATLAATTACFPLFPGNQLLLPMPSFVAGITASDTADLLITSGNGAST